MGKKFDRFFTKKDIQMTSQHMKRCSTLIVIREMKIKSTARNHCTPIKMTKIKKTKIANIAEVTDHLELSICFWWECNIALSAWRTMWQFLIR